MEKKSRRRWWAGLLAMSCILMMSTFSVQAMTNLSMKKGNAKNVTVPLSIYQLDKGLGYGLYNWHSSNSKVASVTGVSPIGRITAKNNGTCIITAQCYTPYPGAYHAWKVTVGGGGGTGNGGTGGNKGNTTTTKKKVTVKSVKLNKTKLTLNVGKTQTLKYTISPKNAKTTVSWSSSKSSVASVYGGKVTAKKPGTATITVKTANGKKKSCKVTVKAPATKVTISRSSLTLGKGDKFKLAATVAPGNTTDKLKWSSSNKKIATVSSKGQVTAKKSGRVTITAKCGSKKASCSIKVAKSKIKKINPVKNTVEVGIGTAELLKYTFTPSNADGMLTWTSSNSNVVRVDQNGKVTGVSIGTATVTVKSNSGASARYTVRVSGADVSESTILIYDGYYQYAYYGRDKMGPMTPFDRAKGLRLTQSNKKISNYIEIRQRQSTGTLRLILSNVSVGGIDTSVDGNVILEMEAGTNNEVFNGIWLNGNLTICGSGRLTARNWASAISANKVHVQSGTVAAYSEYERSPIIEAKQGLTIAPGAYVTQQRAEYN